MRQAYRTSVPPAAGLPVAASTPRVVLICHAEDRVDREGLASWLAATCDLAGIVVIQESRWRRVRRVRNEWKRSGVLGLLDVLAFQALEEVERVIAANLSGREDYNLQVFQLMTLELFNRIFIDESHALAQD